MVNNLENLAVFAFFAVQYFYLLLDKANMTKPIIGTTISRQILTYPLLLLSVCLISCNAENNVENGNTGLTKKPPVSQEKSGPDVFSANKRTEINQNILSIFQDKNYNYWFGTNGAGVYRYDGNTLIQFTQKDGLSNDQVQTIQEDRSGNIWFGTGGFEVSRFDGRTFTTFPNKENLQLTSSSDKEWNTEPDDLWFYAGGGAYRYNGRSIAYLPLPEAGSDSRYSKTPPDRLGPYGVYCTLKDKKGMLWFGTQAMGVCRYDGNSFTWFREKGLAGPAVLALFEDKNGTIWFGNNGKGLFRYDGKSLTNFTEEKGLGNDEFRASGKAGPGTLARIYSINEDDSGNIWIATVDAGVWRYDGNSLTNYTTKDGLPSNAVTAIYKDKIGELWFGTDGVFKFNGASFERFTF